MYSLTSGSLASIIRETNNSIHEHGIVGQGYWASGMTERRRRRNTKSRRCLPVKRVTIVPSDLLQASTCGEREAPLINDRPLLCGVINDMISSPSSLHMIPFPSFSFTIVDAICNCVRGTLGGLDRLKRFNRFSTFSE
jgi:hypothetical protein